LGFVSSDEVEDWQRGELLLQRLLTSPESVERAARAQSELETSLIVVGGLLAGLRNLY